MSTFSMATAGRHGPSLKRRLAAGLWRAAALVLALLPVGMVIAHRSSPVFVVLSALFSLGAVAAEGRLRSFAREAWAALRSPLGRAVIVFLGWCVITLAWSEFRGLSLRVLGEFWLPVAAAFVLSLTLARRLPRSACWILLGAFIAACALILFELLTGLTLRQSTGLRSDRFIFNRPVLTLLVLTPPLVAWLLTKAPHGRIWSLGLLVLLAGTALASDSGAAVFGLAIGCLAAPVAWVAPRRARGLAAIALALALIAAPLVGQAANAMLPAGLHDRMAQGHSRERVEVWLSFGAAVRERPLLGAGFGVSPRMGDTALAREVPPERRPMLAIGHPHNAALQIWAELGAVGLALALVLVVLTLRAVGRQGHMMQTAAIVLLAGAAAVAFVGHGAWQGWWAAALGAAVVWLLALSRHNLETGS